jgi:cytochrome c
MKRKILIASAFAAFFVVGASCNSSSKDQQKSNQTVQASVTGTETAVTADAGAPAASIEAGKKLFNTKGCMACHQLDTRLIGPSLKEIAKAYNGDKKGLTAYLKGNAESKVDPAQKALMEPQLAITKAMEAKDLEAVVDYILSAK